MPADANPTPAMIASQTLAARPLLGRVRLVCVDGPAGSGKTTLAGDLATAISELGQEAAVVHLDDLYEGWSGLSRDVEPRVLAQLLEPLAAGRDARWQRYDWVAGGFGDWVNQPLVDVLVLEGCGSGDLRHAQYTSLLAWVEADRDTRIARGIERDGEAVLPHWLAWMVQEEANFAANNTRERADVRLDTSDL